ncbi:hypothetical protein [Planctomyces sp. SH-PL14]|uniref:hypothetical protein n=1 Tax=Planctomyces sp. SH-PL14 TaxID=1632864 RepID=UPI00078CD2ED|nr:hypothetical protein [Planctomyces sp. SH-PL14]AMV20175.1 hypothetical protein VT03_19925 [Planctomyces sp. SH-PL14]
MTEVSRPNEASEGEWDWIQKPWPWGQLAWIQLGLSFHLHLASQWLVPKESPFYQLLAPSMTILGLTGLATGAFALWKSRQLERSGASLPTYKWADRTLFFLVIWLMVLFALDSARSSRNLRPPAVDPEPVVQPNAGSKPVLQTSDNKFEVDVPVTWIESSPNRSQPVDVSRSDPSGKFGVGLRSQPRTELQVRNAAEFGLAQFEAFSKAFDQVTVLDSTASMRPGRPPFQQTVETVHQGVRTLFILSYQESEKAFIQLSVWGPPDEVEVLREIQRPIWESLREVR